MKKRLLTERFQQLAGIKPLYTINSLNEDWRSEYLTNTLFKKLEDEKGVGRGSDEGQELVKNVLNPFQVEMNKFRKLIKKTYNNPDKDQIKRDIKGEIETISKGGRKFGIEENVIIDAIVGHIYTEYFNRGSNSFVRSYEENHVRFMLEVIKEVLKELQYDDKTFGITSTIDRYLK